MKRVEAILAAAMAISLAGCVLRGKQQTAKLVPPAPKPVVQPAPPAPPRVLSTPQTNVELPPPQAVNLDALTQAPPPEEPPPPPPAKTRPAHTRPAPAAPARTETVPLGPAAPPPESERQPIQEIVTAEDQKRFQEQAAAQKREIHQHLEQIANRRLSHSEREVLAHINSFVKQSDAAESRGDWRSAAALAERGLALARELTDGK